MAKSSSFHAHSTSTDVVKAFGEHARGRVALVTGSNTGIGWETSRALASAGAIVVMGCRSLESAKESCERVRQALPGQVVDVRPLEINLSSLVAVRRAAAEFRTLGLPLHLLILNAGVMACPLTHTADGFELQIGVNHLAHFLLTELLIDIVKASAPSRVVSVSSRAQHTFTRSGGVSLDDLKAEHCYDRYDRYGQSKLANLLHMRELQRRLDEEGAKDVVCVSLHPGMIGSTDLARHFSPSWDVFPHLHRLVYAVATMASKDIPQGASTTLYAALSPDVVKGEYYSDCGLETQGYRHPLARSDEHAKRLWEVSLQAVGLAGEK